MSHVTHERVMYTHQRLFPHANVTDMVQPIAVGVTFSNAVSRFKAQSSNVSFAMFQ